MKKLLMLAAAGEAAVGLGLVVHPAIVVQLLFGTEIAGAGMVMSRIAGIALIALGIACWPGRAMRGRAAAAPGGMLATPEPFVLQKALGDFCVTYEINAFCDQPNAMVRIYTALHQNILDVFNEYGVQIMTPAYESDTEQPKVVPREDWFAAPAAPPPTSQGARDGERPAA